jgi:hypothetical protein
MPNMVWTSEGLLKALANAVWDETDSYEEDFWVELFKSNTTVVYASQLTDFTLADFTGYSHVSFLRTDFGGVEVTSGDQVRTTDLLHPTFTCTGGASQTIYGWLLVGKESNKVWCGQNFATPRVMSNGAVEDLNPFKIYMKTLD